MSAFVELFAATAMFLAIGRDTEEALREDIGPVPVCNAQCERRMGAIRPMEWTMPLVGDVVRARQKRREDVKRFAANQQKGWPRPRSSCVKKFITQETKDATPKPGRPEGGFPGKLTRNPRGGRFFATCDETGLYDSARAAGAFSLLGASDSRESAEESAGFPESPRGIPSGFAAHILDLLCQGTPFTSHFDESHSRLHVPNTQGHLLAMFCPFDI
jgi:hypothetical protein